MISRIATYPASPARAHVLGIPVHKVSVETLPGIVDELVACGRGRVLAPVNVDIINKAHESASLRAFLERADVVYSDGAGVVLGSHLAGDAVPPRVTSIRLLWRLCARWAHGERSLYFLGGPPGIAERAREVILRRYPGVRIAGCHRGHLTTPEEQEHALTDIERTRPDVLLVGFGTPIQEDFIARHLERLRIVPVLWPVGALTSHIAGHQPRAPRLLRRWGMEWAWRFALEPRRMWRRYLVGNPLFVARVVKNRWLGT